MEPCAGGVQVGGVTFQLTKKTDMETTDNIKTRRVAFDTETGGVGEKQCTTHALLSIGAAVYDRDGVLQTFHQLVLPEPGLIIDPGAVAVNGYSPEKWQAGGAMNEVRALIRLWHWLARFTTDVRKLTAVAHNAGHDCGFLMAAVARQAANYPDVAWMESWEQMVSRRWRCSCAALGYLQDAGALPEEEGASLDALTALRTGKPLAHVKALRGTHRADYDARECLEGYEWLLKLGKHAVHSDRVFEIATRALGSIEPPEGGTPASAA